MNSNEAVPLSASRQRPARPQRQQRAGGKGDQRGGEWFGNGGDRRRCASGAELRLPNGEIVGVGGAIAVGVAGEVRRRAAEAALPDEEIGSVDGAVVF